MNTPPQHFHELLPVDGHLFETPSKGRWRAKVWLWPSLHSPGSDLLRYQILFRELRGPAHRRLKLWLSHGDLERYDCQADLRAYLTLWLESEEGHGEFALRWDDSNKILCRFARASSLKRNT